MENKKQTFMTTILQKVKKMSKHPYFAILVFGTILILIQAIGMTGAIRPSVLNFLSPLLIRYIVALGFLLLLGYTGLASLGTAGFMGFGSYLLGYLFQTFGLPAELAFIIGIIVALGLGALVGFISLRIEGMYLAIVTLGLSEIFRNFFTYSPLFGAAQGMQLGEITFFGITSSPSVVYNAMNFITIILLVCIMVVITNIINSPTGRAMLSIKNSTSAAQAMGVSILKYRLLAFLLATLFAMIGGMLLMLQTTTAYPHSWGIDLSLNILAAVIIGGMKNIWGLLIGVFIVFGLKDLVFTHIPFFETYPNAHLIVTGVLIILVVMFYPGGVMKVFNDLKGLIAKLYRKATIRKGKENEKH